GLIPVNRTEKAARSGDLIVAIGGRAGRGGVHRAAVSSLGLTAGTGAGGGGGGPSGDARTGEKDLHVVPPARGRGLCLALTDCGAGGFSSAVGEMGADVGASVQLEKAPLKYEGLSYTEIWISESQERMVLAVPPKNWPDLEALCKSEGVEAAVIGKFEATGRLKLSYRGEPVGDLSMEFLHDGRPAVLRIANCRLPIMESPPPARAHQSAINNPQSAIMAILSPYPVASKEWVIRQYDHEVQGGSVVKPLTGVKDDGPSDAAVINPVLGSWHGLAIANGLSPRYGDLDPYW